MLIAIVRGWPPWRHLADASALYVNGNVSASDQLCCSDSGWAEAATSATTPGKSFEPVRDPPGLQRPTELTTRSCGLSAPKVTKSCTGTMVTLALKFMLAAEPTK